MEDPLPGSCPGYGTATVVFALFGSPASNMLGHATQLAISIALLVCGVLLAMGQGALENISWKKLEESAGTAARASQLRSWLDRVGYDHLVLTLEWLRFACFLVFAFLFLPLIEASGGDGTDLPALLGLVGGLLLVGEALPRFVARYNAERLILGLGPFLRAAILAQSPVSRGLAWLPHAVARLSGKSPEAFHQERLAAEISDAAEEGERSGVLEEDEREMIENIIDLGNTEVVEVMTPRIEVVSIASETTLVEARRIAVESGHSRIPVYEGNRDQIIGVLHVKDLLKDPGDGAAPTVSGLMRKAHFIPETKNTGELLREMKDLKTHIAIVLDEYGGTSGLVTLEDILEEIVGEITDEFDENEAPVAIRRVDETTLRVDAKLHVEELNDEFDLHLPDDAGYETLGGFVFSTLGRVPEEGESFQHNGAEFKILKADPRRVHRVQIRMLPASKAD